MSQCPGSRYYSYCPRCGGYITGRPPEMGLRPITDAVIAEWTPLFEEWRQWFNEQTTAFHAAQCPHQNVEV